MTNCIMKFALFYRHFLSFFAGLKRLFISFHMKFRRSFDRMKGKWRNVKNKRRIYECMKNNRQNLFYVTHDER